MFKSSETGALDCYWNRRKELEMQHMDELKVLENSNHDECMTETGRAPIPTDWVDMNKGDSLRPNYRSSLVCRVRRLTRNIGQQRLQQLLRTRRSDCN